MTRILALSLRYPPHYDGGYELSTRDVLDALAARGHEIEVLVSTLQSQGVTTPDGEAEANPSVLRVLRPYFRDGDLWRPAKIEQWSIERQNQNALVEALDRFRPDVVAPWQMSAMSMGLLTTVVNRGLPMVYAISDDWLSYGPKIDPWHNTFRGRKRGLLGRVVRPFVRVPTVLPDLGASGRFLFNSDMQRRQTEANGQWTYPDSEVVGAGFDTRRYPIVEAPRDRPWRGRLLYAGRLDPRKGIQTVIRALPLLPGVTLEIRGTGEDDGYAETLAELARELRVEPRVEFAPANRASLAERYREADVVVFPSIWEEPFGLVPIESMACGTPVVATGVGGSAEFLQDGVNCLLYPPDDERGLADAVRRLEDSASLRHQLVIGGLRTAPRYTAERVADSFEVAYQNAAHRR